MPEVARWPQPIDHEAPNRQIARDGATLWVTAHFFGEANGGW